MNGKSPNLFAILGVPRRCDLPFQRRMGTEFLVLLVALMTLLSLLSAAGGLALDNMARKWTTGLEMNLVIEIGAGEVSRDQRLKIVDGVAKLEGVKTAHVLDTKDMRNILGPWLGDVNGVIEELPLQIGRAHV